MAGKNGVPEDLSMIQPEATPAEQSFEDMVKNAKVTSGGPAPLNTQGEVKDFIQGMDDQYLQQSSMQEGGVDPELDAYQSSFEDTNAVRARNQSGFVKGAKAVGGGLYQGSLIALEQIGYLGDIDTYTNMFAEAEDLSGNAWSNHFKDMQESGRESEMFKIYEEGTDENSILSQVFKWSSLEGAVSSAVGFGITGLGAASLVSKLGTIKKFSKLASMTDKVMGNFKAAGLTGRAATKAKALAEGSTKAFVGPLASSALSNFYMGQMMATDTYRQSMEVLQGKIDGGEMTMLEAQKLSSKNAQNVVGLNMALTLTGTIRFANIFKSGNRLKGMVSDPTAMAQLKEMIIKGSPTAFGENVYQEMIQMEQINKTSEEAGIATSYSKNYWDRVSQLALSNRAVHAGALGVVGGPIQFAIIQKPMMRKQYAQQKETWDEQQLIKKAHKEIIDGNLNIFKEYEKAKTEAIIAGDLKTAEFIEKTGLIHELVNSGTWGMLDYLRKDVEDQMKIDKEAAHEAEYDGDYQEKGQGVLDLIDSVEDEMAKHVGYETKDDIVYNRVVANEVKRNKVEQGLNLIESRIKFVKAMTQELNLDKVTLTKDFKVSRTDQARFEGKSVEASAAMKKVERAQDKQIEEYLTDNADLNQIRADEKSLDKLQKFHAQLDKRYVYLKSEEGQTAAKEFDKEQAADALKKAEETQDEKAKTEEVKDHANFATIRRRGEKRLKEETTEQRGIREAEYKESIGTKKLQVQEGETFTHRDKSGVSQSYTANELKRSIDGRLFRVKGQLHANTGKPKRGNPPVVYEIKSEKDRSWQNVFTMTDNSFFRPEANQALYKQDGTWYHIPGQWGTYVKNDSFLNPNDVSVQMARQEKAASGIAVGVNGMEVENNRPGAGETLVDTDMASEYQLADINLPMYTDSPYDVEFKIKKGEDGQTFIDVHRVGEEKPLTRLDRHSNLNHTAIAQALTQGEVKGQVIAHYSKKSMNIVTLRDENGEPIHRPITALAGLHPARLPNGKVYISTNKGDRGTGVTTATIAQDGEVITKGFITHTKPDGTKVDLSIPYHSMRGGDSWGLMIAPSGELMPVALRTQRLNTLEGRTEQIAADIQKVFDEVYSDFKDTEDADDGVARAKLEVSNISDKEQINQFRADKFERLKEYKGLLKEKLDETVYQEIRPNTVFYLNADTKDGGHQSVKTVAGHKYSNPRHFSIQMGINKAGKIVPQVQISAGGAKFKSFNITDQNEEFMTELGDRMARLPISKFMDVESGKTNAKEIFEESGLTTDLNIPRPFVGASPTIQIEGSDIKKAGVAINSKYSHSVRRIVPLETVATAEGKEIFVTGMEDFLVFNPDEDTIGQFAEAENVTEFTDAIVSKIAGMPLKGRNAISRELRALLEHESELTATALEGVKKGQEMDVLPDIEKTVGKAYGFLVDLLAKVKAGEEVIVSRRDDDIDPKTKQPEDLSFRPGTPVYNAIHGFGKIKQRFNKGGVTSYYTFIPRGKSDTYAKKIYGMDTVMPNSPYVELFKLRKEISKTDPKGEGYVKLIDKKTRLENTLYKHDKEDSKVLPAESTTPAGPQELDSTTKATSAHSLAIGALERGNNNESVTRQKAAYDGLRSELESINEQLIEARSADSSVSFNATAAQATKVLDVMKTQLVYTDNDAMLLYIDAAREAKLDEHVKSFEAMMEINKYLGAQTNVTTNPVVPVTIFRKGRAKGMPIPFSLPALESTSKTGERFVTSVNDLKSTLNDYEKIVAAVEGGINEITVSQQEAAPPVVATPVTAEKVPANTVVKSITPLKPVVVVKGTPKRAEVITKAAKDVQAVVNEIIKAGNNIRLSPDGTKYKNFETGQEYQRVTTVITDGKKVTPSDTLTSASTIGTAVDEFIRDFFNGTLKAEGEYKFVEDQGMLDNLVDALGDIQEKMTARGEVVVAKDLILHNDELGVAGQVDLLTYDSFGDVRIYDMKTMRGNQLTTYYQEDKGPKYDSTKFGMSNRAKHQAQLNMYGKLLEDTYGLKAKELRVMPIEVSYPAKGVHTTTSELKLLPWIDVPLTNRKATEEVDTTIELDEYTSWGLSPALAKELYDMFDGHNEEKARLVEELKAISDLSMDPTEAFQSTLQQMDAGIITDLRVPFRMGEDTSMSPEKFKAEVKAAKKMLPLVAYEVLESVTAMANKFGPKAIGAYSNGIITLVQGAKEGTAYHEVFHGVADLHLRPFEKQAIADERGVEKWNRELEEELADDFAKYVKNRSTVATKIKSKVSKFFSGLLNWFKGVRSPEAATKVFEKIATGGYAKASDSLHYLSAIESHAQKFNTMEDFASSLSQKESVTLRNLMSDNRLKIIC